MKKLLAAIIPVLLTAPAAFAQSTVSAASSPYAPRYVEKQSQLDAMKPHAASSTATTLYGSAPDFAYAKKNRYVAPNVYTETQNSRPKQKRSRVSQPARTKNPADPYSNDLWNSDQTYASPQTSDPYSVR
ncbi:hypothetical protein LJ656_04575 [Paraburkholderia sp. MMS20-SJTR3]|uniref:Uncharacterized protein n=1 Tax=Paraburkholderia sejongensis TaxID=2886946 RepID=A0ABS8JPM1_9BURK|nr:hypothetical protein [Paraburkholderia sp. MMS20-SJTR3]MCC8391856.1 hypothetical protein [Paraburkholderia sp. MMS20-SJTR3]